jgi:hypothetical protein
MTLSTMSFIVTGHDKITHRVVHVHIVMTPKESQKGESILAVRYKVRARTLSPLVYWFMIRVLKYKVKGAK